MTAPHSSAHPTASARRAVLAGALAGSLAAVAITALALVGFYRLQPPAGDSTDAIATRMPTDDAVGGDAVDARGQGSDADASLADTASDQPSVDSLTDALAAANAERRQLAEALRQINQDVLALRDAQLGNDAMLERLQRDLADATAASGFGSEAGGLEPPPGGIPEERAGRRFGSGGGDTREASLVAAGVDPALARDIQQRSDAHQLARLELIDRATREGWRGSDSFEQEMDALRERAVDLRAELGDAGYDRYLYESGESNRVQIASVIGGSAAALAGIVVGDVIESYAGGRIYGLRELRNATREGSRGELVPVVLQRNGQYLSVDIERGPLGVTMRGIREAP